MTRQYGRVKTSIWNDDDFRQLTDPAQSLYQRLLSQPSLNLCGVGDWRPKRLALVTRGMTVEKVQGAADELIAARYIVTDEDSDEVLVRTFAKHEGVIVNPKTAAGLEGAFTRVVSPKLRLVVAEELRKLRLSEPNLKGWVYVSNALGYGIDSLSDSLSGQVSEQVSDPVPILLKPETLNPEPEEDSSSAIADAIPDPPRPDVESLCAHLADRMEANGSKRPRITQQWRTQCRLLLDKDGRTEEQVRKAIDWSQTNPFWMTNILSMSKLREKYDQLRLAALNETGTNGSSKNGHHPVAAHLAPPADILGDVAAMTEWYDNQSRRKAS